ncbi:hypothetical protein NQK81_20285 [Amycolatopsis roodepoortensis]|uniref:hypothetical protein n=1 Tax=Amycolatopsis roodepoortensis TaxID=700274 RepID=UPI00214ADE40|nr:hypothetical protein [Amycolatopsis roodepoortensis]UUV35677.1 hypothetical protein NQK81_20285 [Amycolatopsis roodepoortensis]
MKKSLRRAALALPGVVAAGLLGVGGVADAAPADPVQTLSCSHGHSNKDSGEGRTKERMRYRSGPHTNCSSYGWVAGGTLIYYHCYTTGTEVNGNPFWTWGRIAGTQKQGWFSDHYLSDGGATKHC